MYINKIAIFFLVTFCTAFSQTKKSTDTIFVYEKVFVYKTVSKKSKESLIIDTIFQKKLLEIKPFKKRVIMDTLRLKIATVPINDSFPKNKKSLFSIYNYGISGQFLVSKQSEINSFGVGIGIFATKKIYKNKLYLDCELLFSQVFSTSNRTASFDGYYITPDAVLYYEPKNIKTQQLSFPITTYWNFGKLKPLIGISYTKRQTQLDFFSYPNNTTLTTIQQTTYNLTNNYIDFVYGVKYDITKRIALSIKSKQTIIQINDINIISENVNLPEHLHFFPNQVTISMFYKFKK